jgi:hypothetical protein
MPALLTTWRGHDGAWPSNPWKDGGIPFGHRALPTTREAEVELELDCGSAVGRPAPNN